MSRVIDVTYLRLNPAVGIWSSLNCPLVRTWTSVLLPALLRPCRTGKQTWHSSGRQHPAYARGCSTTVKLVAAGAHRTAGRKRELRCAACLQRCLCRHALAAIHHKGDLHLSSEEERP
jgi:hypothetical protein